MLVSMGDKKVFVPEIEKKSGKRGRMEMAMSVMKAMANGDSRPTNIMYSSNMCWNVVSSYLANMESQGLIVCKSSVRNLSVKRRGWSGTGSGHKERETNRHYFLTEKGLDLLNRYLEVFNVVQSCQNKPMREQFN